MSISTADTPVAAPVPAIAGWRRPGRAWPAGLALLGIGAAILTVWGIWSGSRSDYYASIALSMSKSWSNFLFGAFDPAGTVTLDKIPGSFWIPALFVRLFGFSTFTVILPNALAAVGSTLITAVTAKNLAGPRAGLLAGAVVATTPILVAVSRSNQPETFFVLGLALTAWAASKALSGNSFRWLLIAGMFIAVSFQAYMLEAWAVWPALAAAYLCTKGPLLRKLWQTAVAGVTSLALSLVWIVIVALVPASSRPYVGSTLHNSPWEMVFGYNGLGRFGSSTADPTAYNSFTPPFSGSAGTFRVFNQQLAGQVGWMIPAAAAALLVLVVLRYRPAITVFLGVWLVTFYAMFAAVAGMHQFYTAALAIPMALTIGLAMVHAHRRRAVWAQLLVLATAAVTALVIGTHYGGYSVPVALIQTGLAVVAALAILRLRSPRWQLPVAVVTTAALLLTPAVWSAVTIAHPSSTNPVAGGVWDMGGGFGNQRAGGGRGGGAGQRFSGRPGGAGGFGGFGGRAGGFGNGAPGNGAPGNGSGNGGFGAGGFGNGGPGGGGFPGAGSPGGGFSGRGQGSNTTLISYLRAHQGSAKYLVATFGAQSAAGLIIDSDGGSVLPIGGFDANDPVPTLTAFVQLVKSGQLKYVLLSGGMGGGTGNGTTAGQIRSWVEQNFTAVSDAGVSGLYVYSG